MAKKIEKEDEEFIEKEPEEEFEEFKSVDAFNDDDSEDEDDILRDSDLNDYPEEFNEELEEAAKIAAEEEKRKKEAEAKALNPEISEKVEKKKESAKNVKAKKKAVKTKAVKKKSVKKEEEKQIKKKTVKKKTVTKKSIKKPEIKKETEKSSDEKVEEKKVVKNKPIQINEDTKEDSYNIFNGRNIVIALCLLVLVVWAYAMFLPSSELDVKKADISTDNIASNNESLKETNIVEDIEASSILETPEVKRCADGSECPLETTETKEKIGEVSTEDPHIKIIKGKK